MSPLQSLMGFRESPIPAVGKNKQSAPFHCSTLPCEMEQLEATMQKQYSPFAIGDCVRLMYAPDELVGRIVQLVGDQHAVVAWLNLSTALHSLDMLERADLPKSV